MAFRKVRSRPIFWRDTRRGERSNVFLFLLFSLSFAQNLRERIATNFDSLIKVSNLEPKKIGICLYSLDEEKIIFSHNGQKGIIPASNQKLFVSACALEIWGEQFKRILATRIKKRKFLKKHRLFLEINSESNNYLANTTFWAIGKYKKTSPQSAIKSYLKRHNVPTTGLFLVDGSGRSRKNRATPLALIILLNSIYSSPLKDDFLGSLAVAGKRGTLKRRLLSLRGMVYAKTGYLYSVNALSGYLFSPKGNFSFSIIINDRNKNFSNWEFIEVLLSSLLKD